MAMNDNAKVASSIGVGVLIGKLGGNVAWWALAGATVVFILNSPATQLTLKSGAQKAYGKISRR